MMMMNGSGSSSLNRKQPMSPVNGGGQQSHQSGSGAMDESGGNSAVGNGDVSLHRHAQQQQHHQMHHHLGQSPSGGGAGGGASDQKSTMPLSVNVNSEGNGGDGGGAGGDNGPAGGHLDSPAELIGVGAPGRRHQILPPLEKPPRDPNALNYYRNSRHSGSMNMDDDDDGLGPLPYKWEKAYTDGGESYFIDHNTGTSHWLDPRLSKYQKKSLVDCQDDELPYGWEKINDPQYGTYFIDHVNRRTQYENPVLEAKRRLERQSMTSGNSTLDRSRNRSSSVVDGDDGISSVMDGKTSNFTRNPAELCGDRFTTTLLKSSRGLGFTIVGGDDNVDEFLQIKSIVPNGPAWLDGKLLTGDVLVYVNDTCVLGFNHHEMVNVFQSILPGETVTLEVCRGYPLPFDPNDPNTEVVTTIAVDGIGGPAAKESEKARLMMDLNMDGNYNFLDMSGGRKFIPPYKGVYLPGNNGGGGGNGGVYFDDNLKTLPPMMMPPPMERAPFEILAIQIVKGAMGFGFTIADSATGQRVKKILDRTCCKTLQEGDILLAINATSVTGMTHTEVVQVLKECSVGKEAVLKIQRGGSSSGSVSGYPGKGLNLNAIGKFSGGGGAGASKKMMNPKDGNLYRSKTPTADLFSTQQKEVLPIRPKTPLVDTRVRSKTPSNELNGSGGMNMMNLDAINNNNNNSHSGPGGGLGVKGNSSKSLVNSSRRGDEQEDEDEDEEEVAAVNDDELDSVLKELEVMENNSKQAAAAAMELQEHLRNGGNNLDAKSTASYADHDSINNDIMPYGMDPYGKMVNHLTERLSEATITGPGGSVSTYLTDNPAMYHRGYQQQQQHLMNGGMHHQQQQQQQFMHHRNGALDTGSVNSMSIGGGSTSGGPGSRMGHHHHQNNNNNGNKMYHQLPLSSSQSDLHQSGRGMNNGDPYANTIYANTMGMTGGGRQLVNGGGGGQMNGMVGGGGSGQQGTNVYTTPSIPIMPPIPTYHQDSCYCFECEEYHRQQQEYNLHMQNQIQLQNLNLMQMQQQQNNRAPSAMSNPYARKEYLGDNNGQRMVGGGMWNKQQGGGGVLLSPGMDGSSPGEFALSEVTLERQTLGFGFRIVGGTEEGSQVTVGHIVPGGAADMDPRIATGDEILSIDMVNVIGASHHRVVQLMGEAGARGRVTMVLRRRMLVPNGGGLVNGVGNEMPLMMSQNFRFPYDVIVSRNENEGFGFVIISSTNQYYGATIGKLIPGSPADRCNELKVGDRIIAVNRIDIAGMSHGEIVNLIKESGLHVRLTIGQPVPSALTQPAPPQQQQMQHQSNQQPLSVHQINLQQQQALNNKNEMYFDRMYPQQL